MLSAKHEKFCQHYLMSFDAAAAAREAGYSAKSAAQLGYQILRRDDVQEYLRECRASAAAGAEVDQIAILRELQRVAFADMRDVLDWGVTEVELPDSNGQKVRMPFADPKDSASLSPDISAAVAEVSVGKSGFKIKMHDKLSALDKLARHLGMYERDNKQVADGLAQLVAAAQGTALPLGRKETKE